MRLVSFGTISVFVLFSAAACAESDGFPDKTGGPSQPSPSAASCTGHCGESSDDGSCYCDDQCNLTGDCCSDFADACGAPGSGGSGSGGSGGGSGATGGGGAGNAGGSSGGSGAGGGVGGGCTIELCNMTDSPAFEGGQPCFCDPTCAGTGDCCANKVAVCG